MATAIVRLIEAANDYCEAYAARFEWTVGNDAILGDEGIRPILCGLRTLLNGPLGRADGGNLDRQIMSIAEDADLLDSRNELTDGSFPVDTLLAALRAEHKTAHAVAETADDSWPEKQTRAQGMVDGLKLAIVLVEGAKAKS